MAIKINRDGIQFRNFSITNSVDGIYIDGTFTANGQFVDGTQAQGGRFGYVSGGRPPDTNVVDKFPFVVDTDATDVGDLSQARSEGSGQSSSVSGYTSGGYLTPPQTLYNTIDKFPFAVDGFTATDVGDIGANRRGTSGNESTTDGFVSGGYLTPGSGSPSIIEKFPFATDTNAADTGGDLSQARHADQNSQSSTTHGYTSGGNATPVPAVVNTIDKFPFSISSGTATDVGDLTVTRNQAAGQSSSTHGYSSGGDPVSTVIDKFPFSVDTNATDVGDLSTGRSQVSGQSSTTHGYTSGGNPSPVVSVIDKFPFASDNNAGDVGVLTRTIRLTTGQQV